MGFAGLPFLVTIVKYIILFIWSLEQALVETAVLLMGKEVPLATTKKDIVIRFDDLLSFSKSNIISKAKAWVENKSSVSLNYNQYLTLFMLFQDKNKSAYRMLDLIQENIRYEYDDSFHIRQCITNYNVNASISMKQKFLIMPFFSKQQTRISRYQYVVNKSVSY